MTERLFKNPSWIEELLITVRNLDELPPSFIDELNQQLINFRHPDPIVSIVIPAYNEEVSILRSLYSLARNKTTIPTEIIVINNNSTDRTQEVLDKLLVRSEIQTKQGCGPARQLGQEIAKGKYILMGDADCFYPENWIERMTRELMADGVTCVYGPYSFLGTDDKPRWSLSIYEFLRDLIAGIRHVKRPYLNALGMSMGYVKELGLRKGFVDRQIRGEDGRMCFQLMQYGKVKRVKGRDVSVWTLPRTLDKEGNLLYSIFARVAIEIARFKDYFYKQPVHDTHATGNFTPRTLSYFEKYKNVHKQKDPVAKKPA